MVRTMTGSVGGSNQQLSKTCLDWARAGRRAPPSLGVSQSKISSGSSTGALFLDSIRKRKPASLEEPALASSTRSKGCPKKKIQTRLDLTGKPLPKDLRLRTARVSQKTLDRYQSSIATFHAWGRQHDKKINDRNLDSRVVEYMTWLAEH